MFKLIQCSKHFRFRYSFICQGTSTRRQRSDLFGRRVKETTSKLAGLSSHYPFCMLNVKQGSVKHKQP